MDNTPNKKSDFRCVLHGSFRRHFGEIMKIHRFFSKADIKIDIVARVASKQVRLNDEAEDYIWAPARVALGELDIEPNARHTLELYSKMFSAV